MSSSEVPNEEAGLPNRDIKMPPQPPADRPKADQLKRVKKRLFVCCDGTWQDGVNNQAPLTNVSRFARCLDHVSEKDDFLQITYYDNGIGNGTDVAASTVDGATGRGISAKIRNAYSFLSHNYNFDNDSQDEIYLVGFSRGAFTVQCLASLIDKIGLLKKEGLEYLYFLFTLWANQDFQSPWNQERPLANILNERIGVNVIKELRKENVRIKACIVWDTVSALGLPLPQVSRRPMAFVGKTVPAAVDFAFQALALNETRKQFQPCIWEKAEEGKTMVKQCWFLGSHADVGGGNEDSGLAGLSLLWMVAQAIDIGVSFNRSTLLSFLNPKFLQWDLKINNLFGTYNEAFRFISNTLPIGVVKRTGWYWWFTGPELRTKYIRSDIETPSDSDHHDNQWSDAEFANLVEEDHSCFQLNTDPTEKTKFSENIHFTVRLLMAKKRNRCKILRNWTTVDSGTRILWERFLKQTRAKNQRPYLCQILESRVIKAERDLLKGLCDQAKSLKNAPGRGPPKQNKIFGRIQRRKTGKEELHIFFQQLEIFDGDDDHPRRDIKYPPSLSRELTAQHLEMYKNQMAEKGKEPETKIKKTLNTINNIEFKEKITIFGRHKKQVSERQTPVASPMMISSNAPSIIPSNAPSVGTEEWPPRT